MRRRFLALMGAATLAPLAGPVFAADPVAETPAARQGRRLVEGFTSSTDEAAFLAMVHELYPTAGRADAEWLQQRVAFRQIQLHAVTAVSPTEAQLVVLVPDRGDWLKLLVAVAPEPPHAITAFTVRRDRRPADVPGPPMLADAGMAAAVGALADAETAADRFSGAVLIARDGKPFLAQAWGWADVAAGRRNTVETQFRFGSMGKMFTSVAILQLAQAGKLELTAPIVRYLPDYSNRAAAEQITVDMLMTHASGLGDIFNARFDAHRDQLREPKDFVALFGGDAPTFTPGTRQQYSNFGFVLLGRIVEVVSGLAWDRYFDKHIFAPAGMTSTGHRPEGDRIPRRANAYWTVNGKPVPATVEDTVRLRGTHARPPGGDGYIPYRGSPGGGGYSTVGDMLRFAEALLANRLLDAAHTELLTVGKTTLPGGIVTGYDFGASTQDGRRYLGHDGGAPGQSGSLRIFAPERYVIVVLANRDSPAAQTIASFISERAP